MAQLIIPADLVPFAPDIAPAKAAAMIEDAEAMAVLTAPCLVNLPTDDPRRAAAKAILRGAVLRWNEAGTGAVSQEQSGPFGHTLDTRQPRKAMFWPSEITQLQGLCSSGEKGHAFAVDTVGSGCAHLPWCSLAFGATYCSCGVDIAGEPIYEVG
ncbi:hypothetical protein [Cellulomonas shaoxiangyii]|uniref:Head-to-tail adaptor n=1 Tax=Cellulomonas shaoxiangyii TaxID=2566013 RepID=A0A4P7SL68_9CELL|nr:hypothetical protein [Cellulomonas shaoxiangyii]QCB93303.1 hypothetical protein E5225_06810 [Cellulomonas shaoxiangyii]TGY82478.1 hypothetical protein E5226_13140 [Cellulomonas shaoxiangyii]